MEPLFPIQPTHSRRNQSITIVTCQQSVLHTTLCNPLCSSLFVLVPPCSIHYFQEGQIEGRNVTPAWLHMYICRYNTPFWRCSSPEPKRDQRPLTVRVPDRTYTYISDGNDFVTPRRALEPRFTTYLLRVYILCPLNTNDYTP